MNPRPFFCMPFPDGVASTCCPFQKLNEHSPSVASAVASSPALNAALSSMGTPVCLIAKGAYSPRSQERQTNEPSKSGSKEEFRAHNICLLGSLVYGICKARLQLCWAGRGGQPQHEHGVHRSHQLPDAINGSTSVQWSDQHVAGERERRE